MRRINCSRYVGDDFGISAEDLLRALCDFFLESGFQSQYMGFSELNQHTLEQLKEAIQRALEYGKIFDDERSREMQRRIEQMSPEQIDKLLDQLVQKLADEGYINLEQPLSDRPGSTGPGNAARQVRVEVTNKSIDFLDFKPLKAPLAPRARSGSRGPTSRSISWDSKR